jgi:hypothetical protein
VAAVLFTFRVTAFSQGQAEKTRDPGLVVQQNQQVVRSAGDTLASYYLQSEGATQSVRLVTSGDNGQSWSDPRQVFSLDAKLQGFSGIWTFIAKNGQVHLFLVNSAGIWHTKSGNSEWEAPKLIFSGRPGALRSALQLSTGRIVLPFYFAVKRNWWDGSEKGLDRFTYMGNFVTSTLSSDDDGATWTQSPDIIKIPTPSLNQNGAVDPILLQKKDGTLWMLIANQRGWLYETFSKDGVSWSENRPSRFMSSEAPASITRLDDGPIVLIWNSCLRFPYLHGGVYALHAAISEDDGKTWIGYREIYRDSHRAEPAARGAGYGTGYPTAVAIGDGKLLIHAGQGKSQSVFLFDPKTLYETKQQDDFSQGLDTWSVFGTHGVDLVTVSDGPTHKVLSVRKAGEDWPAAAVWNFPAGRAGQLTIRLRLIPGFQGAHISLTDHFSVPFDQEAELNALYNFAIGSDGVLGGGTKLAPDTWHQVVFTWHSDKRECSVAVDGKHVETLPQQRLTDSGPNYLRLRAASERTGDTGFLVESVTVDVSDAARR